MINGEYYYLQIHVTTKCLEESQQNQHSNDEGSQTILTEVEIKQEIVEKPLPYEALTRAPDQFQYDGGEDDEGASEYLHKRNVENFDVLDCVVHYGSGSSVVKLENQTNTQICDPSTSNTSIKADSDEWKRLVQNDLKKRKGPPKQPTALSNSTTNQPPTFCDICNRTFESSSLLRRHFRFGCGFTCLIPTCRGIFRTAFALDKHIEKIHQSYYATAVDKHRIRFQCLICKIYTPTSSSLKAHLNNHNARLPCEICGKEFLSAKTLKQHKQRLHNALNNIDSKTQCEICKKYVRNISFKSHMSRLHSGSQNMYDASGKRIPQLQCDICKTLLFTKTNLIRHMVSIHRSKPPTMFHNCEICKKGFASADGLRTHMKKHNDPNPYKFVCNFCGKKCRTSSGLEYHLNRHKGLRPYKCTECDKTFVAQHSLSHHMRVHTGIKPYICSEEGCDRAYAYRIDLKRHLWGQHQIYTKKFPCEICGRVFPENQLLKKHMQNHPY